MIKIVKDHADYRIPEGEFVIKIDALLKKNVPENVIPWSVNLAPEWAKEFAPRVIVDLGSGVGGFLQSALTCLGAWGCLRNLERVIVVESDTTLISGGADGLKSHLTSVIRNALLASGKLTAQIDVFVEPITLLESNGRTHLVPVLESCGIADLVIASHITYYFGDGSGMDLMRSIEDRYLSASGRIWCVIRKRQCPIYEQRARTIGALGVEDVKPFDFAEYFEAEVAPSLDVSIVAASDKGYLCDPSLDGRWDAIFFLMWRAVPFPECISTPYGLAATSIVRDPSPLFLERHFILASRVIANEHN